MALQHLYTNVPTKMSMFNRMDGYDTFACSDGLNYEMIESDLSTVTGYKMTKNELNIVREQGLAPLYCQYLSKSGRLVQSCISFSAKDYTGEKSAFFAHSVIIRGEEKREKESFYDVPVLNKTIFKTKIEEFNLTSPDGEADNHYPEIKLLPGEKIDVAAALSSFDRGMIKRTIYAILNAYCGKGKNLFILLSDPDKPNSPISIKKVSEVGLDFINAILQVFPLHIRSEISFATYLGEPSKYSFKATFITPEDLEGVNNKGIILNYPAKAAIGLPDETVAANGQMVEFFYSLISNVELRNTFLDFVESAVEKDSDLRNMNIKQLTDFVTIFMECCGQYGEYAILPNDDKIYDYLCTYEKYRTSIDDKYRAVAFKCLERYNKKHIAIPKNVFAKISKIYPKENFVAKRTIMDNVLALIHTDLMRDKLFVFISSNYENEDGEMKVRINEHLCSVYYGGFLQPQLLGFFTDNFATEPIKTQNMIVEKMILTVRNSAVRNGIMHFFEVNQDHLTEEQKDNYYDMLFEQINSGDELSTFFLEKMNDSLANEDEAFVEKVSARICSCVENDQKRKHPTLLPLIMANGGKCGEIIASKMINSWSERKIFNDYLARIKELSVTEKADLLIKFCQIHDGQNYEVFESITKAFCEKGENAPTVGLYDGIALDNKLETYLKDNENSRYFSYVSSFLTEVVRPAVASSLNQVFDIKLRNDGMDVVAEYAKNKDCILNSDAYAEIEKWNSLLVAVKNNDSATLVSNVASLGKHRAFLATKLKEIALSATEKQMFALLTVLYTFFEKNKFRVSDSYKLVAKKYDSEQHTPESDFEILSIVLKACDEIIISGSFKTADALAEKESETYSVISEYLNTNQKKGKALVKQAIESGSYSEKMTSCLKTALNSNGGTGFFARLFGKK